MATKEVPIKTNNEITADQVRLIDENGEQVGVVPFTTAIRKAEEADLDLVEISPQASPPVCKILDYGRHRFEQKKKKKEADRKSRAAKVETKELWLRPNTDMHDVDIKVRHAKEFLENGDKVKFTVKFRGRELSHKDKGTELLASVIEKLGDTAVIDQEAKQTGRTMILVVAPPK